mgnify:CR=1 FL=1
MAAAPGPFADTVAALATAPGRAAVAVVRLSGPAARAIAGRLHPGIPTQPSHTVRLRTLRHPTSGVVLDRALVSVFWAPRSYTGEDVVEFATHGGLVAPQLVLEALFAAGARPALAGEFTRRAVWHGKMDLLQAEAVLELVEATSPAAHAAALRQLDRGLSARLARLRERLLELEAQAAYGIDFPEEDSPPVPPEAIAAGADAVAAEIAAVLAAGAEGELLRAGARVVLAGRPNAGKSSLFNALIGAERAIVTDIPGTTRDAVEAVASVEGYPVRLVDTAGLRASDDPVERLGVEVARQHLAQAQLVLFCVEAGRPWTADERVALAEIGPERALVVRTQVDRFGDAHRAPGELAVSARTGQGLAELRRALVARLFAARAAADEPPWLLRARHRQALERARGELGAFAAAVRQCLPLELAATHLRAAATALEELLGVLAPDEVLGAVFASFCVGK